MRLFHLFVRKKPAPPVIWERTPTVPHVYLDEDGRRHRGDAPYLLPKDEKEMRRLDYQHFLLRQVLKGKTFAPVDQLLRTSSHILDVGCGTARWGCEIAAAYPRSTTLSVCPSTIARCCHSSGQMALGDWRTATSDLPWWMGRVRRNGQYLPSGWTCNETIFGMVGRD